MIIDVEPEVEMAKGDWRIVCDTYNEPRYVVRQENGEAHTVHFCPKALGEFLPSMKVSEMMKRWEDGINQKIEEYRTILSQGWHILSKPVTVYEITTRKRLYLKRGGEIVYRELPFKLEAYDKKSYKRQIANLEKQKGKMTFVKLV